MLASLRSTISRSFWLRTRSISWQATEGANEAVMYDLFGMQDPQEEKQLSKPKQVPLDKIEVAPPQDPLLNFFASRLMNDGKRARAEKSASEILLHLNALTRGNSPMPILRQAVLLASPAVKTITHKSHAKATSKPFALNERQRTKIAIDWILAASEKRPGHTRGERIARECIGILQNSSQVLDNKENMHKAAMVARCVGFYSDSTRQMNDCHPFRGNLPRMR